MALALLTASSNSLRLTSSIESSSNTKSLYAGCPSSDASRLCSGSIKSSFSAMPIGLTSVFMISSTFFTCCFLTCGSLSFSSPFSISKTLFIWLTNASISSSIGVAIPDFLSISSSDTAPISIAACFRSFANLYISSLSSSTSILNRGFSTKFLAKTLTRSWNSIRDAVATSLPSSVRLPYSSLYFSAPLTQSRVLYCSIGTFFQREKVNSMLPMVVPIWFSVILAKKPS